MCPIVTKCPGAVQRSEPMFRAAIVGSGPLQSSPALKTATGPPCSSIVWLMGEISSGLHRHSVLPCRAHRFRSGGRCASDADTGSDPAPRPSDFPVIRPQPVGRPVHVPQRRLQDGGSASRKRACPTDRNDRRQKTTGCPTDRNDGRQKTTACPTDRNDRRQRTHMQMAGHDRRR